MGLPFFVLMLYINITDDFLKDTIYDCYRDNLSEERMEMLANITIQRMNRIRVKFRL